MLTCVEISECFGRAGRNDSHQGDCFGAHVAELCEMNARVVEGGTVLAIECTRCSNTSKKLVTRTVLTLHMLESWSFQLAGHRELCVRCLQLVKIHRICFFATPGLVRMRVVPVLRCGSTDDNSTANTVHLQGSTCGVLGTISTTTPFMASPPRSQNSKLQCCSTLMIFDQFLPFLNYFADSYSNFFDQGFEICSCSQGGTSENQ